MKDSMDLVSMGHVANCLSSSFRNSVLILVLGNNATEGEVLLELMTVSTKLLGTKDVIV
jgi:hypothetical protein